MFNKIIIALILIVSFVGLVYAEVVHTWPEVETFKSYCAQITTDSITKRDDLESKLWGTNGAASRRLNVWTDFQAKRDIMVQQDIDQVQEFIDAADEHLEWLSIEAYEVYMMAGDTETTNTVLYWNDKAQNCWLISYTPLYIVHGGDTEVAWGYCSNCSGCYDVLVIRYDYGIEMYNGAMYNLGGAEEVLGWYD